MKIIEEKEAKEVLEKYDHALFTGNYYLAKHIKKRYRGTNLEPKLKAIITDRAVSQA